METIELTDGGIILYQEAFLPPDLADRYFVELRDSAAWEQKPGVFGRLQPRLTASYGDGGVTYFFSGTENKALPWTPTLLVIKQKIEAVEGRYNYRLLNRYRLGGRQRGNARRRPHEETDHGPESRGSHHRWEAGLRPLGAHLLRRVRQSQAHANCW